MGSDFRSGSAGVGNDANWSTEELVMKDFNDSELKTYLSKISDKILYAYNVYQIEGEGKRLFSEIKGDKNTIMGLPIIKIKSYLQEHR